MSSWETPQTIWVLLGLLLLMVPPFVLPVPARRSGIYHQSFPEESRHTYKCLSGRLVENRCRCDPCWDGHHCEHYVDNYSPRFLVHAVTAVVPVNATGIVYRAWSSDDDLGLTCPLGPGESARCPCATVTYQLFAPPGDRHFQLDPVTGILTRDHSTSLHPGTTYSYKIMVQGTAVAGQTEELLYDLLDLRIYVSPDYVRKIPWT